MEMIPTKVEACTGQQQELVAKRHIAVLTLLLAAHVASTILAYLEAPM